MFDVYCHTSPSGKRYVGQSCKGSAERWREHVSAASRDSDNPLHRAIRKYGAGAFRHELLEQCDTQAGAHASERRWIASRGTLAPGGYNATAGGEGMRPSDEVRAKMSAALRGNQRALGFRRTASPEECAERSRRQLGRKLSEESIAKRSAKQRGAKRNYSAEARQAISAGVAAANGRRVWDEAACEKQASKSRGRHHTPEEIQKMSAAWTPEMRLAASERARARNAKRKVAP